MKQEKTLENKKFATLFLNKFNSLSDQEILNFFDNENIKKETKSWIINYAYKRLNKLPVKIFILASIWAEDAKIYLKNYLAKIEKMNYSDFVDLIYNGILNPEILLELTRTNIYKKYLEEEITYQSEYNLQCLEINKRMYTSNDLTSDLKEIGYNVLDIMEKAPIETENVESIINEYFDAVIDNVDKLNRNDETFIVCFKIITAQMKNHKIITMKMIEFYLHYRIKELGLDEVCKNVIVTLGKSKKFGHYTMDGDILKGGTLRIYYEYLINMFTNVNTQILYNKEQLNDVINTQFICFLSHEINHALDRIEFYKDLKKNNFNYEIMETKKKWNYFYRNYELMVTLGEKEYNEAHNIFISEVQADLFSFMESLKELNTKFKSAFPNYILENLASSYAGNIVSFYLGEDNNIVTPMEKFDNFYHEKKNGKESKIVIEENPDIFSSLMMGDKIPEDVLEFIRKIATKEIITTDLYETIKDYINSRNENYENVSIHHS